MISNDASYTGYKCYGSLMSTNSTSFTDSGQPIKRLNLSESDHDTPVLPQQKFPNIRRKKLASKEERDRFLHTFEERSTYRVNEVDLGFLERKRNVLKKKQELLNKTLLANKVNKKLTESFSNENRQNGGVRNETKIFEAKELQKSEKNDVNQAENVNTDRNSETYQTKPKLQSISTYTTVRLTEQTSKEIRREMTKNCAHQRPKKSVRKLIDPNRLKLTKMLLKRRLMVTNSKRRLREKQRI